MRKARPVVRATTLEDRPAEFFLNASHLNAGTLADARLPSPLDADTLEGQAAAAFAAATHDHDADYSPLGHDHDADYAALAHAHAGGDITSGTVADGRLSSNIPKKDVAEAIGADCWAFTNGIKESGFTAKMGEYTSIAYAAGNFTTSNATVWTVEEADQVVFRYARVRKFVHLHFQLQATSLGAGNPSAPTYLDIALPFTAPAVGYQRAIGYAYFLEEDKYHKCLLQLAPGATSLRLYYISTADALTPWPAQTLTIYCDFLFEVA